MCRNVETLFLGLFQAVVCSALWTSSYGCEGELVGGGVSIVLKLTGFVGEYPDEQYVIGSKVFA